MTPMLAPRILGLGDNTVDTYVDQGMQYPGGNAVNVAVLAHRLGMAAGYLGCLGTDAAGDLLFQALQSEGVDLSHCRRIDGANARAMIGHRDGDRHAHSTRPAPRGDTNTCCTPISRHLDSESVPIETIDRVAADTVRPTRTRNPENYEHNPGHLATRCAVARCGLPDAR